MGKIAAIILILLASIGGGIYYISNQNKLSPVSNGLAPIIVKPSPTQEALLTTDESIDSDITALDKDLSGLDASDKTVTKDINGL